MKYLKKKKRNGLITAVVISSVLLVVLLALLLWLEIDSESHGSSENLPTMQQTETIADSANTEAVAAEPQDDKSGEMLSSDEDMLYHTGEIKTPYLTLYFDGTLTDHLAIVNSCETPYVLEFYAVLDEKPEQRIFDILIGDGTDGNLGIIETDLGEAPVSMVFYAFTPDESWTQGEINTVLAMQEVSNDLLNQLKAHLVDEDFQGPELSTEVPDVNVPDDMEIETPFCTLLYPAKWEAYLQVEQTETENYLVAFYGKMDDKERVLLFKLIFGGDYGEQIGVVKNRQGQYIPVNLLMEEMVENDCSEDEMLILYEMQEAVNQMIGKMPLE